MRFDFFIHWACPQAESENIMAAIDALRQEVQETRDVTQAAVTLLQGLKQRLDEAIASGNMGDVQALADDLDASNRALADAIAANTPADPNGGTPTPTPTPTPGDSTLSA